MTQNRVIREKIVVFFGRKTLDTIMTENCMTLDITNPKAPTNKSKHRKRIGKREAMKNLVSENNELKELIGKMQQQIAAIEAQNSAIEKEIIFFHKQILDTIPDHPELKEKGIELLNKNKTILGSESDPKLI